MQHSKNPVGYTRLKYIDAVNEILILLIPYAIAEPMLC